MKLLGNTLLSKKHSTNNLVIDGLVLWLDAKVINGMDGDLVASWNDSSGNGYNATQSNSSNRPILKTNILNGRNVVRFNGSSSFLDIPDNNNLDMGLLPKTVFLVFKANSYSGYPAIISKDGGYFTNGYNIVLDGNNGKLRHFIQDGAGAGTYNSSPNLADGVYRSCAVSWDRSTGNYGYINGTSLGAVGDLFGGVNLNNNYPLRIGRPAGADTVLNGDIAEIVMYNRILSTSELTKNWAYLNSKYNLLVPS
jgi:hypothetical protein